MKYALVIYETPAEMSKRTSAAAPAYWAAWKAFADTIGASGVMVGGAGLEPPSTATSVRAANGKRTVQDGPFADSKELLGGFFLIDVPNLDAALAWAARVPVGDGTVEVRPLMTM